jgi:2',3'-cyclic-nucleotide 2'-phosphodiesterase/3'-nucleotidase
VDVNVIGNHDLEAGLPTLQRFTEELESDMLGANLVYAGTREPYLKPYTILERDGLKIAFLGLTTPIQSGCITLQVADGELEVLDMLDVAQHWMEHIRTTESPDLIIGLFHAGFPDDEIEDTIRFGRACFDDNNPIYIAENVPGFDAIFLGHLHKRKLQQVSNNQTGKPVWLLEPGYGGAHVSILELEVRKTSDGKVEILRTTADLVNVTDTKLSLEIEKCCEEELALLNTVATQSIALLMDTICNIEAFFGSSFFVDLVHKVKLQRTGADISFASPLSTNVSISSGSLTFGDLFRVYRFENTLMTLAMTGREIQDYLEYSYSLWVNQMSSPHDRLLKTTSTRDGVSVFLRRQFEHPQYFFDSAAGLDYEVDVTKPIGERVKILRLWNGELFDRNKTYTVATTAYRVLGAGGHMTLGAKIPQDEIVYRILHHDNLEIRELIRSDFSQQGVVRTFNSNNSRFVPNDYLKFAKEREFNELK